MTAADIKQQLDNLGNPKDAEFLQRFFKTGVGEYGEGDVFLGIRVPVTRKVAAHYADLPLPEIDKLLASPVHEHRLAAVIIMTIQMARGNEQQQKDLYDLYLHRTDRLNNWDIVDASCRDIVGRYLFKRDRHPLYSLARSRSLWERRIAMVSTWEFIRQGQLDDTFKIAEILIGDQQDLIHKAVGWMLREAGKKDRQALCQFLDSHAANMPRTMLRYAIEHLTPRDRQHYMSLQKELAP